MEVHGATDRFGLTSTVISNNENLEILRHWKVHENIQIGTGPTVPHSLT